MASFCYYPTFKDAMKNATQEDEHEMKKDATKKDAIKKDTAKKDAIKKDTTKKDTTDATK